MTQLLFRNRWLALVWVAVSLMSVGSYFAEGGGSEKIAQAAAELRAGPGAPAAPPVESEDDGFSADEELVDKAGVEDDSAQPRQQSAASGDKYVVVNSSAMEAAPPPASAQP